MWRSPSKYPACFPIPPWTGWPPGRLGSGGLFWKEVRVVVQKVFGEWPGTLIVYDGLVASGATDAAGPDDELAGPEPVPASSVSGNARSPSPGERRRASRAGTDGHGGGAEMSVINFYSVSDEYGCFSNFSPHPIRLGGKTWPTSEHYLQAMKFAGTPDEEDVRQAKSPMVAARMGRSRKRPLRKDWESAKDRIMLEAVLAKFTQHADLREVLLGTGKATIVEHTENDDYWGDDGDGTGKNRLGQTLMRVREELRSSVPAS